MTINSLNTSIEKLLESASNEDELISFIEEYIENLILIITDKKKIDIKKIMTYAEKVDLKNKVNTLNKTQQIEIFKLISNVSKYNENSNGIFINLSGINNEILWKMKDLVDYFLKKNKKLEEEETLRNNMLENVSIDTNINNNIKTIYNNDDLLIEQLNKKMDTELINGYTNLNINEMKILKDEFSFLNNENINKKKISGVEARILKKCKELNNPIESVISEL